MTDYYGALKEAAGSLPSGDIAARRAFFNRARRLLIERLQTADPPVPARELRAELDAFDAAVKQIDLELQRGSAPAGRRAAAPPVRPPMPPRATPAAPPKSSPAAPRPAPPPPVQRRPAASSPPPPNLAIPAEDVGHHVGTAQGPDHVEPEFVPQSDYGGGTKAARSRFPTGLVAGVAALLLVGVIGFIFWRGNEAPAPRRAIPVATRSEARTAEPANLQYVLRRQLVYYRTIQPPGTIVIAKSQHFLYVVRPDSVGLRYTFGMGPDCAELGGLYKISRKDGDAQNAKTAALYIGDAACRIRAIENSGAIGQNLRTPGIQLADDDFADLLEHTGVDTRVVVTN